MPAPGTYGAGTYGSGLYGGGTPAVPILHVFIAFDADPLALGGVITGDDSTCESLGGWVAPTAACSPAPLVAAGRDRRRPRAGRRVHTGRAGRAANTVTLNDATSRVYAGHHSIKVTALAAGDISAHLYGRAGVTAGRTYLLWAHVRPEATARTGRVTLTWRSATGVGVGAGVAERVETTGEYTRIGLLATAPPGSAQVDVSVAWPGCDTGEVHYVDTVTMDYVGTAVAADVLAWSAKLAGRNHQLDRTDAGEATLTLDNRAGYYTPDGTATLDGTPIPAPYLGNIEPRRRVWILAEWAGVLDPVFSGYTRRWVQAFPGGRPDASLVTVSATDGFRWLTGTDIPAPYRAEVLADEPLSLFPLDEPGTAPAAGDLVDGYPAQLLASSTGGGETAFGADTALPVTITGRNTDGGSTSLGLNLETPSLGDRGSVLDLRFAGGMPPQLSIAPWTFEFWFRKSGGAPGIAQILFRHLVSGAGTDAVSGFQVTIETSGALRVTTGAGEVVATTAGSVANDAPHHVALTYEAGGTHGTATLYVDGSLAGADTLSAGPFAAGTPNNAQLGGALATLTNAVSFPFTGWVSHVAFYYRRLPVARIQAHHLAGTSGFYLETDGDRVEDLLSLGGWPAEDTRVDAGLTQLMPRDWSPTNVLALAQDTTAHGGGALVMDATGKARCLNRHRFVNEVPVAATFSRSSNSEPEHVGFAPDKDDARIENVIEVNRIGGGTFVVSDAGSIARYGRIKGQVIPLGAATDAESVTHARWRLARTAAPRARVDELPWLPGAGAGGALWPLVLPREFGDRITITELPLTLGGLAVPARANPPAPAVAPGADARRPRSRRPAPHVGRAVRAQDTPSATLDVIIGRVHHWGETGATWATAFQLEPALIDSIGVCDHPVYGVADTAACVAGY